MKSVAKVAISSMLAVPLIATTALTAQAQAAYFTLRNQTRLTMTRFYASPTYTSNWEEDILGSGVLYSGSSSRVRINDGRSTCWYDFLAVFSNGNKVVKSNVNICNLNTYTVY
jgi:hypothetical protein